MAAAVIFGSNGSLVKVLLETGLSAAQVTFARTAGTALIAGVVLLITNRAAFRITPSQAGIFALLGVMGVAILQWAYTIAVGILPVGIALLFEYLAVLMVALFAFFVYRERVKARLWIAIAFVLAGLALVAQVWDASLDPFGVFMALCAAVSLAIYFLLGEREVAKSSPMAVGFWSMGFAAVFWLAFGDVWALEPGALGEAASLGGALDAVVLPLWIIAVITVVFGSFTPFLLSLLALRHLTATAAGITASFEVVFAFVVAWLWLGESLELWQILGASVVLVGIVVAQTARVNKVIDPDLAIARDDARIL
ncbi:MAG: EamA family transporter [Cryobacterium sp.]|nr:EamA family transporter [Cryobacterium sp.]